MHLCFPAEAFHALAKGTAIRSDGLAQSIIGVEDGAETERKHGSVTEANADYSSMFKDLFFAELSSVSLILADHYAEISTWITEDESAIHALDAIQ